MIKIIKKLIHIKPLKNFGIYTFGTFLLGLFNFILIPVYSKYITPADFGTLNLLIVLINILVIFVDSGLNTAFSIRFYKDVEKQTVLLYNSLLFNLFISIIIFLVFIFHHNIINILLSINISYAIQLKVGLIIALTVIVNFFTNLLRLQEKAFLFLVVSIIRSAVFGGLNILFLVILKQSYESYIDALLIALSVISLLGILYFLKIFPIKKYSPDIKYLKRLLVIGIPLIPHAILSIVISSSDKYILNSLLNETAVGLYSLGYKIGNLIDIFITIPLGQAFSPVMYRSYAENTDKYKNLYKKVWFTFIFTGYIVLLSMICLLDTFFYLFIDKAYWSSYWVVIIISFAYFFWGCAGLLGSTIVVKEKTFLSPLLTAVSGGLNIGLNLLFIPIWGMFGAAFSTLITFFVLLICYYILTQKLIHVIHEWKNIITITIIFSIAFITAFYFSGLSEYSPVNTGIKIIILIGYSITVVKLNKQKLKTLVQVL